MVINMEKEHEVLITTLHSFGLNKNNKHVVDFRALAKYTI